MKVFDSVFFSDLSYDNRILLGHITDYDNRQLHILSKKIINSDKGAFCESAYDVSYTDVYDFSPVSITDFEGGMCNNET